MKSPKKQSVPYAFLLAGRMAQQYGFDMALSCPHLSPVKIKLLMHMIILNELYKYEQLTIEDLISN